MRIDKRFRHTAAWLALSMTIVISAATLFAQTTRPGGSASRPHAPPTTAPSTQPGAPVNNMQSKLDRLAEAVAMHVSNRHGFQMWRQKSAVQADIVVELDGKNVLEGTMLRAHDGRTRFNLKGGATMALDGQTVWVSPAAAAVPQPGARLHLLTWPSFLTGPVRLQDSNAVASRYKARPLQGNGCDTIELQFKNVSADQPNAHYVVYSLPGNGRLTVFGMASTVAVGANAEEAMSTPRCITFEKFEAIESVLFPTSWTIWNWNKDSGLQGSALGHVTVSNVKFVIASDDAFTKPADAREEALPQPSTTKPDR